jgi:DNA-directed RNA polymerase specialized sigma24 family protein
MTVMSLFHESEVTLRSLNRFGRQVHAAWPANATLVTAGTMIVDVEASSAKDDPDRRRAAWMVAAQGDDRAAYETLLRDCIPFIQRVARGQGVRPDYIYDVVQETLTTVHQARQTYDPSRSFTAWLRTAARRRAIDGLRRSGQTRNREVFAPFACKIILIQAAIPRKQYFKSIVPTYSIWQSKTSPPGSARQWSVSR